MGEYVYCIIKRKNAPKNFEIKGIEDNEVYSVTYKDLAAVSSKAPLKDYEPTEENVEKHKLVSQHVLENHTVLPVAFGMVFKTKGILTNTIRYVYPLLKKSLRLIDNRIELGVKAILPKENSEPEIENKDGFIKNCEAEFINALDRVAVQSKNGKLFSDRLAFNRSYLVNRDKIDSFSEELEKLDNKYNGLKVQYTGPWPPYNFVDIRIMGRGRR